MDFAAMDDGALIKLYRSGNESALEFLITKHQRALFSYIIVRVKDEDIANDIFQDIFVKAIQTIKRGKYNEEGKFLQWMYRIAHNKVIDHFRAEKRRRTVSTKGEMDIFDTLGAEDLNVEELQIKKQIEADLVKLIEHLPDEQKEVLKMRHYAKLSFKEISEATGVSINTALGRMRYALINLRKLAEKHQVALRM